MKWGGRAIAPLRSFAEGGLSYLQHYSHLTDYLFLTKQHYFKLTNLHLQSEEHKQLTVDSRVKLTDSNLQKWRCMSIIVVYYRQCDFSKSSSVVWVNNKYSVL